MNVEYYRSEAARAKRMAELVHDPDLKSQWLKVEEGYKRLAHSAELQAKAGDYLDREEKS
jgi:hypothetical protein